VTAVEASAPSPVHPALFTSDGLRGSECASCTRRHFPPAAICPWCGADDATEVTLSSAATLWAWTSVNAAPPGYDGDVPYGFGVVELAADGLHVVTRLTESDPTKLASGMPMRFTVVPLTASTTTYAFTPA